VILDVLCNRFRVGIQHNQFSHLTPASIHSTANNVAKLGIERGEAKTLTEIDTLSVLLL